MDPFGQTKTSKPKSNASAMNPFAKALAETERSFGAPKPAQPGLNPFSEALARTGGRSIDDFGGMDELDPLAQQRQLEEQFKRQEKEKLRRKLHNEVQPREDEWRSVFNAREERTKKELEETRKQLELMAKDIINLYKEVDLETFKEVVNPGRDGTYHISYFQKLRSWIQLLRQHVKSATTWANQFTAKHKKKKKGPGLDFRTNETKAVHDTMHHERSNAFSGS